jgi:ABC-2 type transport system permease protein
MSNRTGISLPTLTRTELLALWTVRIPWVLMAATVTATLVMAVTPVIGAGMEGAASIGTSAAMLAVLDATGRGSVVVLLFGVLTVAAEFRHGTATVTFLHTPRRARVIAAKAMAVMVVGTALAVVNLATALAVGMPTGAVQLSMVNGDILLRVLGLLLAYPLYGLLGVGTGALLIYQPVAVVLPLTWLLLVEDLVLHLVPHAISPWSLSAVTAALANAGDVQEVLPVLVGGLALLGYALLLLSLGAARVVRRDIT